MAQKTSFKKAVEQLYFNVDITDKSINNVITGLKANAELYQAKPGYYSLSNNLDIGPDDSVTTVFHNFQFSKSPLVNLSIDTGYIRIKIGESRTYRKILNIDWRFQFSNKTDADLFFEGLKQMFTPVSSEQKIEKDKLNEEVMAEFSTRNESDAPIKDVSFLLNKLKENNKYQIIFLL